MTDIMDTDIKYKLRVFFIVFTLCFIVVSCDRERKDNIAYLTFVNNSEKSVFLFYSIAYPDSLLDKSNGGCDNVLPHSKCESLNRLGWNYSKEYEILQFFVFDSDTIHKYGYNHLQNSWILKKYKYTEQQLEQMNWTVTYP